jgi:hypothetical protein
MERRRSTTWLVMVAIALAWLGLTAGPGRAACAQPTVALDATTARPGQTVVVSGMDWRTDCETAGGCTHVAVWIDPVKRIRVFMRPAGGSEDGDNLAEVNADARTSDFDVAVTIPGDLSPGRYVIGAQGSEPDTAAAIAYLDVE